MLDRLPQLRQQQRPGGSGILELRIRLLLLRVQFVEVGSLRLTGLDVFNQTLRGLIVLVCGHEIHDGQRRDGDQRHGDDDQCDAYRQ